MIPIIVHQAKEYSQDLHSNIPLDWKFHHTPSGYMDRDGCLKAMTQLSNVCGASPVSNQILFFGGHDSYLDECAQKQMKCRKIQPFLLKAYDSIKDQTNNNGPNEKLKYLYNVTKSTWMLKYGTKKIYRAT